MRSGIPGPVPPSPSFADTAEVDTQLDAVAAQIGLLRGEIVSIANCLRIDLAATLRERAQMLELLGTLQERSMFIPEKNVSAIAQAVLVAKARTART